MPPQSSAVSQRFPARVVEVEGTEEVVDRSAGSIAEVVVNGCWSPEVSEVEVDEVVIEGSKVEVVVMASIVVEVVVDDVVEAVWSPARPKTAAPDRRATMKNTKAAHEARARNARTATSLETMVMT